jgi:hypothetical protein
MGSNEERKVVRVQVSSTGKRRRKNGEKGFWGKMKEMRVFGFLRFRV